MSMLGDSFRVLAALASCPCLVACVSPLSDDVPALDESRAQDVVAVVDVVSTRFYERNGGFGYAMTDSEGNESILYASAPAFRVRARVVTQLYGPRLNRRIFFKTHSHWGKRNLTNGNLKLVHLVTDGKVLVEPDESDANVGIDSRGKLFVPVYPSPIHFLPCGIEAHKRPVTVRMPVGAFGEELPDEPVIPTPPDLLKQQKDEERAYYRVIGDRRYPRFGIPVEDIATFLHQKYRSGDELGCYPP